MAAATVPKLYRSVIDDVINSVREVFLDDGVDEHVLHELKLTWEKKLNESKAIDANAKEPDPAPVAKQTNRSNNSNAAQGNSSRGATQNRDNRENGQQNQQQMQAHVAASQSSHPSVQLTNHHQVAVNHVAGGAASTTTLSPQLHIHPQTNIILGPSGVQYTTNEPPDGQKTASSVPQKLVLFQGLPGQTNPVFVTGGPFNFPQEIFNQIANQQASVITAAQPNVVHPTNVAQNTIQYAAAQRQPQPATRPPQPPQPPQPNRVVQLDGTHDTSDEDDDEDEYRDNDDDHDDNDDEVNDDENEGQGEDEEPLNSEDDVSDEDPTELFDTDNVVVCQYDKITRSRNKWKFHLKDGIMNLQGKDYVFQKAIGDAEW